MNELPVRLFRLENAARCDPAVDHWFEKLAPELRDLARLPFQHMRDRGDDVRELLHDGHPTACIGDAAFGYVNAFTAHVNVGFFLGARLNDPAGLLEGTGKHMRHVKLRPGSEHDAGCLEALIESAYHDLHNRLASGDHARHGVSGASR